MSERRWRTSRSTTRCSRRPGRRRPWSRPTLLARGREIAEDGLEDDDVPACNLCHGRERQRRSAAVPLSRRPVRALHRAAAAALAAGGAPQRCARRDGRDRRGAERRGHPCRGALLRDAAAGRAQRGGAGRRAAAPAAAEATVLRGRTLPLLLAASLLGACGRGAGAGGAAGARRRPGASAAR